MLTVQSMCVQVDMNAITPTQPHANPTPNDPSATIEGIARVDEPRQ